MLVAQDIQLNFDRSILKNINLTIKEGEIIGIVGKSGAGKTSLLKIISGLLEPSSGIVEFEGIKLVGPRIKLIPGHAEIQLVNQDFHLETYHTVEENIREQVLHLPLEIRDKFVDELLYLVELSEMRTQKAMTLSGGEQQRLAIARALACEPKVLLLDEPFVHLDGRLRSKMINYLLELRKIRNTTIVLVSHDGSEMLSLADIIYSMNNGMITRKGLPKDFYYKPKTIQDAKLFGAVNSIRIDEKRIVFRPDEYSLDLDNKNNIVNLSFDHFLFTGPVYENYFKTENKEKIVLYSFNSMENVSRIAIKRKG